jgi:hypothetical protein
MGNIQTKYLKNRQGLYALPSETTIKLEKAYKDFQELKAKGYIIVNPI